jgi:nucleoside-diphosphate kinase
MVKQLSSGRCLAMSIHHQELGPADATVVSKFRDLVGPSDPELARTLRPKSLRAKYGSSVDENALHCTDLPEDGKLEVEYFFKILQ